MLVELDRGQRQGGAPAVDTTSDYTPFVTSYLKTKGCLSFSLKFFLFYEL